MNNGNRSMLYGLAGLGVLFSLLGLVSVAKLIVDGELFWAGAGIAGAVLIAAGAHRLSREWVRDRSKAPSAARPAQAALIAVLAMAPGTAIMLWIGLSSFQPEMRAALVILVLGLGVGLLLDARVLARLTGHSSRLAP